MKTDDLYEGLTKRDRDREFFMLTDDDSEEAVEESLINDTSNSDELGDVLVEKTVDNSITPEEFGLHGEKAKNIYCDKNELYEEIRKYQKDGKSTDALGEMLIKIALHMSTMQRFWRYSHNIKEELVSQAVLQMLLSVPKFNLKDPKKNPFGYLSMICYRDMLHSLKKHFKQDKIKKMVTEAHISKMTGENPSDDRLAMLKSTLEKNEEYRNFLNNKRYPYPPKQTDMFALSKSEQSRRRKIAEKMASKSKKTKKSSK